MTERLILCLILGCSILCVSNVAAKLVECTSRYVRCADNTKCISETQLCDYKKDCDDLSDERLLLCQAVHKISSDKCGHTYGYRHLGCSTLTDICKFDHEKIPASFQPVCNEIRSGLKPSEELVTLRKKHSNLEELFSHLAASFNDSTRIKNDSVCPPLYVEIGSKCVAIFLVAEVTWVEAKQFCESISGTLAIIRKLKDYEALLKHFKTHDLATNFWIGGIHQTKLDNSSSWMWLDEKDIVMGAPYWSVYHTSKCTMRKNSDHCYVYDISPMENTEGYCLSMDYEFHYYFTDWSCFHKRNPLCYLNEK